MITWKEKVAFVGMSVRLMIPGETGVDTCFKYKIKVSHNPGACSIGHGNTLDEAIGNAARSLQICWHSVERRMTNEAWENISHT